MPLATSGMVSVEFLPRGTNQLPPLLPVRTRSISVPNTLDCFLRYLPIVSR